MYRKEMVKIMQNSKVEFILLKLRKSKFRAKFHLKENDKKYIKSFESSVLEKNKFSKLKV